MGLFWKFIQRSKQTSEKEVVLSLAELDMQLLEQLGLKNVLIPEYLGIRKDSLSFFQTILPLVKKLEEAWDPKYIGRVKKRLMPKNIITEEVYPWYELELKRFFILTSIYDSVPMYNEKVDAIWHEMLMFTRSYQQFCNRFIGTMIHHEPNDQVKSSSAYQDERSWFLFLYSLLFDITPFSRYVYSMDQLTSLNPVRLEKLQKSSEQEIKELFFRPLSKEAEKVVDELIPKIKEYVSKKDHLSNYKQKPTSNQLRSIHTSSSDNDLFLYQMLWFSWFASSINATNDLKYQDEKHQLHESKSVLKDSSYDEPSGSSSWSVLSASLDDSSHRHHHSSHHDSYSSHSCSSHSCSSCSSCSGCSS